MAGNPQLLVFKAQYLARKIAYQSELDSNPGGGSAELFGLLMLNPWKNNIFWCPVLHFAFVVVESERLKNYGGFLFGPVCILRKRFGAKPVHSHWLRSILQFAIFVNPGLKTHYIQCLQSLYALLIVMQDSGFIDCEYSVMFSWLLPWRYG